MPYVRVSLDKRGYEHFFLVQPAAGTHQSSRPRLLYWFRTPPGIKVGREPFDTAAARALETQYPGIAFDWERLRRTPVPTAQPEYWRERRRAERATRRLRRAEDREEGQQALESTGSVDGVESGDAGSAADERSEVATAEVTKDTNVDGTAGTGRRRRRRRGRRSREQRHDAGAPESIVTDPQESPGDAPRKDIDEP